MSVFLEWKKAKRTGFLSVFFGGGILAAAVPALNMAFRSEMYVTQKGTPVYILLSANWQLMAMLNVLLVVVGACLLYHTEFADHAMQKMKSLPMRESAVFAGKAMLIFFMSIFILMMEAAAVVFCSYHWFQIGTGDWGELWKSFGYALLLMLPCIVLSLLIAEFCRNMWVSLGIGVICVFTATMLPANSFIFSLFPFAMPFQMLAGTDITLITRYICAVLAEMAVLALAEILSIRIRREFV